MLCQVFQGLMRGLYENIGIGNVSQLLFGKGSERTGLHNLRDEAVSVGTFAF